MESSKALDLLLEIEELDRVPRLGYARAGLARPESVTEHCWHVLFLVWVLGRHVSGLDLLRAIEIALIHDLAELRLGDIPSGAGHYFPAGVKQAAEAAAIDDLLGPLSSVAGDRYREYAEGKSREAALVKACDKLQVMLKVSTYERSGVGGLAEFWQNSSNFPDSDIEQIRALFRQLRERKEERPKP